MSILSHRHSLYRRIAMSVALFIAASSACHGADLTVRVTDPQGRPLADAVVALRWPGAPPADSDPVPAIVSQRNMTFVPHVLAISVNTSVLFPNYDNTRHHVYSFSSAKTFDIKLYAGLPDRPILFDKPGVVALGCNIHDQMQAFIVVSDAPRIAVTDKSGKAVLADVPDIEREVEVWHEWLDHGSRPVVRRSAADISLMPFAIDIAPPPAPPREDTMSLQHRFDRIAQ